MLPPLNYEPSNAHPRGKVRLRGPFLVLGLIGRPGANREDQQHCHEHQHGEHHREGSRLRRALGVHGSAGQQPVLVFVPLGQMVLDQIAPVKFARVSYAPERFALVRFARLRYATVRSARVRFAPVRFARVRYAPVRFALVRFARPRIATVRFAPVRSA